MDGLQYHAPSPLDPQYIPLTEYMKIIVRIPGGASKIQKCSYITNKGSACPQKIRADPNFLGQTPTF